jgi:CubicO group peptidase (beta-lactamase class C family)
MSLFRRAARRVELPADLTGLVADNHVSDAELRAAGLDRDQIERIWRAAEALFRTGLHPAVAICLRRRGHVVLDRAIGWARGRGPGVDDHPTPCTPDTPFCIFSASKAVTAMVIHHLDDQGLLHIDDRVVEYLPEFGRHGKEWVTLRHVLTHRAGIPSIGDASQLDLLSDPARIVELLCDTRPTSRAGRRLAYHAISGGFVLGEVVRRATGKAIEAVLAQELLAPLGFRGMRYGVPADRVGEVATNWFTGPPQPFPITAIARRALGVSFAEAAELSNHPAFLTSVIPSGNVVATANELCRFFQLLLDGGELDGVRVLGERTVRRAINETAYMELDTTVGLPIRYGTGLHLGSRAVSVFGFDMPQAFGHLGFIHVYGFADPERDLSVGIMTSGKPVALDGLLAVARLLGTLSWTVPRLSAAAAG